MIVVSDIWSINSIQILSTIFCFIDINILIKYVFIHSTWFCFEFYFCLWLISNWPLMIQSISENMLNADKPNPKSSWVNTSFSALDSINV